MEDQTGIAGRCDFTLKWRPEAWQRAPIAAPALGATLQEHLPGTSSALTKSSGHRRTRRTEPSPPAAQAPPDPTPQHPPQPHRWSRENSLPQRQATHSQAPHRTSK